MCRKTQKIGLLGTTFGTQIVFSALSNAVKLKKKAKLFFTRFGIKVIPQNSGRQHQGAYSGTVVKPHILNKVSKANGKTSLSQIAKTRAVRKGIRDVLRSIA